MNAVTIVAYGRPITQGSKVRTKFAMRDSNSETLKPWRDNVRSAALEAIGDAPPILGPVTVDITFVFDRPRAHFRTGRNAHLLRDDALTYPSNVKSGDIDKLQRSCFDALTDAGVWKDDCQVIYVTARKDYTSPLTGLNKPRAVIRVSEAK